MSPSKLQRSLIMLTIIVFGCAVWSMIGITIRLNPQPPVAELRTARNHWQQSVPAHYRYTVHFFSPLNPLGAVRYTVADDHVIYMELVNALSPTAEITEAPLEDSAWYYTPYGYAHAFLPSIDQYTMDALFTFAEEKISQEPTPPVLAWCGLSEGDTGRTRYEATYDEERGYIKSLNHTNCITYEIGLGLLCPMKVDCRLGLQVSNFEPLP